MMGSNQTIERKMMDLSYANNDQCLINNEHQNNIVQVESLSTSPTTVFAALKNRMSNYSSNTNLERVPSKVISRSTSRRKIDDRSLLSLLSFRSVSGKPESNGFDSDKEDTFQQYTSNINALKHRNKSIKIKDNVCRNIDTSILEKAVSNRRLILNLNLKKQSSLKHVLADESKPTSNETSPASTRSSSSNFTFQTNLLQQMSPSPSSNNSLLPNMIMGYLKIQELNKVLDLKLFVVLTSGNLYLFEKQSCRRPIQPPYGENCLVSMTLKNYSISSFTQNNTIHLIRDTCDISGKPLYSGAGLPADILDINEFIFKALDCSGNIAMREWMDAFHSHIKYSKSDPKSTKNEESVTNVILQE